MREDPTWEICRYGANGEPEIVIVCGYATEADAKKYQPVVVRNARARAVLKALSDA